MMQAEMSDEKLLESAEILHQVIHIANCFSAQDVLLYQAVVDELGRRGYQVDEDRELVITKCE